MTARGDDSPYRAGGTSAPEDHARERDGIVDELIKQFADPLAFYRELVQNSIDAGATSIAVTLAWEPDGSGDGGVVTAAVRDDGCGMDREILEEQLTVLFRSGKEKDDTKIGKFGVGFVSVLAIAPKLVAVRTCQGKGEQWTLHLANDQSYELFRAEGGGSAGTTVTLHVAMPRSQLEAFVEGSERALTKWCRHTEIPVRFVAHVAGAAEPLREARIDRPFGLDAMAVVDATGNDGRTRVVAGLPHDGTPYLAFFNRGLLLHETSQDVFGAVAVKILDGGLEHTLSRDNVRRDEHHDGAMRFARHVVDDLLTERARSLMEEIAEGGAIEPRIDALHAAIVRAGLAIGADELAFPLLHADGGRARSVTAARLKRTKNAYAAFAASAITEAVARSGGLVLDLSSAAAAHDYLETLSAYAGRPIHSAESALTLAEPVEPSPSDLVLLDRAAAVLDALGPAPRALRFVTLTGALATWMFVAGAGEPPEALTADVAKKSPFSLLGRPPLWLNAAAPIVAAARRAAVTEPDLAALLLARAVLLNHGSLDDSSDDAWLDHALERIGGGA